MGTKGEYGTVQVNLRSDITRTRPIKAIRNNCVVNMGILGVNGEINGANVGKTGQ